MYPNILKPRYQKGDSLKCLDGDDVYSARCVKIEHDGNQYSYLIHYNGWSKSYDEWMFDDDPRLNPDKTPEPSKLTDQSVPTIKILPKSKQPKAPKTKKIAKQKVEHPKGKLHLKSDYEKRFVLRIRVPSELKTALQDDQEFILRQRKVIPLPAPVSVHDILESFLEEGNHPTSIIEGMESYFNSIVGAKLLYKFERPLYADYLSPFRTAESDAQRYPEGAKKPSEMFGFTQLVRFIYHLDEVLGDTDVEKDTLKDHLANVQLLAEYLSDNVAKYHHAEDYCETSPEYHRRAQV